MNRWNLVAANPVTERFNRYKARLRHLQALNNIKGQVNNRQPQKPKFLSLRQKSVQLRKQKDQGIHFQNDILIDRMISAKSSLPAWDHYRPQSTRSLSRNYRRKVERQIDLGNKMIVKKLEEVSSAYPLHKILDETDNYLVYKCNIQNSRAPSVQLFAHDSQRSVLKTPRSGTGEQGRPSSARPPRRRPFSAKK